MKRSVLTAIIRRVAIVANRDRDAEYGKTIETDKQFAIKNWQFETKKHPKTRFWSVRNRDLRRVEEAKNAHSRSQNSSVVPKSKMFSASRSAMTLAASLEALRVVSATATTWPSTNRMFTMRPNKRW